MLPVCVEAFVRLFFHILKFVLDHWFLVLVLIIILALLRKPLILGILGYVVNLADIIPLVGKLTGIAYVSPFVMGIIWGGMVLVAPVNIFVRIAAFPIFVITGFVWDAITNLPIPVLGSILDAIPLSPLVGFLLTTPTFNYIIIILPAFYGLKLWFWGGTFICDKVNTFLQWLE